MLGFWTNYTLVDPDISQWFKQGESKEANVSAGRWGDASVCLTLEVHTFMVLEPGVNHSLVQSSWFICNVKLRNRESSIKMWVYTFQLAMQSLQSIIKAKRRNFLKNTHLYTEYTNVCAIPFYWAIYGNPP